MSAVMELNDKNFGTQIAQGVTLVDFWAPWCGPCRRQAPILEALAPKLGGRATIGKVNVDDYPELAAQYGIRSIPTLILFKNGRVVQQWIGVQDEATLLRGIEAVSG